MDAVQGVTHTRAEMHVSRPDHDTLEEENAARICHEHIGQPLLEWPKGVKRSQ
jgi:hypothetical protein